jgi:hydrogenase maturation protease
MIRPPARVVVAGLGNEYRRDDGAGPLIAERAVTRAGRGSVVGPLADPLDLLGEWDDADLAVVVDAVHSGQMPGTLTTVELVDGPDGGIPGGHRGASSTHGIGLAGVLRLARAVDRAPGRVVVVGIEGGDFSQGTGLSPEVQAAVPSAVRRVVDLIEGGVPCA